MSRFQKPIPIFGLNEAFWLINKKNWIFLRWSTCQKNIFFQIWIKFLSAWFSKIHPNFWPKGRVQKKPTKKWSPAHFSGNPPMRSGPLICFFRVIFDVNSLKLGGKPKQRGIRLSSYAFFSCGHIFWTRIIKIGEGSTNGLLQNILRPFCSKFIFYLHFCRHAKSDQRASGAGANFFKVVHNSRNVCWHWCKMYVDSGAIS